MKAKLLLRRRQRYRAGLIEMVIWQLPDADHERPHGLKYRLVYVRDGRRLVGYDNERGKGDHKHLGDEELPYCSTGVHELLRDFWADVRATLDE